MKVHSDNKRFKFISKGPKGNITKVVLYQELGYNFYNLAFGDWDNRRRKLDQQSRSNNGDRDKILATVASTVLNFMKRYPNATVLVKGHIPGKTRLYQMAINKHLSELSHSYSIKGSIKFSWEPFKPGRNYEMFVVRAKRNL